MLEVHQLGRGLDELRGSEEASADQSRSEEIRGDRKDQRRCHKSVSKVRSREVEENDADDAIWHDSCSHGKRLERWRRRDDMMAHKAPVQPGLTPAHAMARRAAA